MLRMPVLNKRMEWMWKIKLQETRQVLVKLRSSVKEQQ